MHSSNSMHDFTQQALYGAIVIDKNAHFILLAIRCPGSGEVEELKRQ